jgi:hypothetical protein
VTAACICERVHGEDGPPLRWRRWNRQCPQHGHREPAAPAPAGLWTPAITPQAFEDVLRALERMVLTHCKRHEGGAYKAGCDVEWCAVSLLAEHRPERWTINVFGAAYNDPDAGG